MGELKLLIFLGVLVCLVSCVKDFKSAEELQTFIADEDNGLTKSKRVGDVTIKVTHRPTDLLVDQELNGEVSEEVVKKLRNKYSKYAYFTLSLSAQNKEVEAYQVSDQGSFGSRVQQLSFGMTDVVELHTNTKDTVAVADYVYQRTFGIGNSSDMLFAFERDELKKSQWIQFQLDDFGLGIGTNRFRFKTKHIQNPPQLKY